ncbi:hypothetical protein JCM3775_000164 [Rhodotorula graminis]
MADTAGSPPPPSSRKKRVRGGVDTSLIIEEPRKRKYMGVELGGPSTRHGGRSGSPNPATIPATDPEGFERVKEQGIQLYDRLVAQTDPSDPARPLYYAFSELPSRDDYPDYYKMIKKPISFTEIKAKLDGRQYACLSDLRTDINQIYVNAKRYNAPGSQIFLDAKKQHKLLKDTYAVMTGEAPPPEEHDEHDEAPQPAPARGRQSGGARGGGAETGGATAGGKAATLRPWLNGKLDDVIALEDANGRNYAENFHVLPDRGLWPDYYQLIAEPMAFETVRARVQKNHYKAVEPFYQDVMTIFENAMFYNEESSRIWKDAMVLKKHFGNIMQEEPPEYVPPKKSHKRRPEPDISVSGPATGSGSRSRRQSSTFPAGEDGVGSEAGGYEDEDASEDEASRHGSVAPAAQQQQQPQPFAGVVQPKPEDIPIGDPYALPGGSPALAAALALPDNPLLGLGSASAALLNSPFPAPGPGAASLVSPSFNTLLNGSTSPSMPLNGRSLHAAPTAPDAAAPTTFHPRLVARLSAPDSSAPLLTRFEVRCVPSGAAFTLDTALLRQHALAVPSDTQRVEITPVLAGAPSSSRSTAKGKGRAAANGGAAAGAGAGRIVAARARPAALVSLVEDAVELPPAPRADGNADLDVAVDGGLSRSGPKRYALVKPRAGLSTLEFVVGPAGAASEGDEQDDGQVQALRDGEEVYRLFVTR